MTERQIILVVDLPSITRRCFASSEQAARTMNERLDITSPVLHIFATLIQRIRQKRELAGVVIALDSDESERRGLFPAYKQGRAERPAGYDEQLEKLLHALSLIGWPIRDAIGWEADDVCGTVAFLMSDEFHVVVASTDKDMTQLLVNPGVHLWHPFQRDFVTPSTVREKYGVEPIQMRDFLALAGDSSDSIPGVKGVGAKHAARLLKAHGSIAQMIHAKPTTDKQLAAVQADPDHVRLMQELVGLNCTCPMETFEVPTNVLPAWEHNVGVLGFEEPASRLHEALTAEREELES